MINNNGLRDFMICERCGHDHQYPNDITIACETISDQGDPIDSAMKIIDEMVKTDQIAFGGARMLILLLIEAKKRGNGNNGR